LINVAGEVSVNSNRDEHLNRSMKKTLLIILLVITITGIYGVYLFNKKPVDTRDQNANFEISAADLVKEFSANEEASSKKYVDKILIVTGEIKEINMSASTLFLDGSDPLITITCSFYTDGNDQLKKLKPGDVIEVKGKCTGKLIDIVMNNCILANPQ